MLIFSAHTPQVRFDTVIHWQDDHRFLKTAFDTAIFATESREEIQFGYACRSTSNNTPQDIARFEVSCHKYADLSESRCGVAILNDCKYGIYAKGGSLRLSLHKGGCSPDFVGDKGDHRVPYAFLPHDTGFGAQSVIRPPICSIIPSSRARPSRIPCPRFSPSTRTTSSARPSSPARTHRTPISSVCTRLRAPLPRLC